MYFWSLASGLIISVQAFLDVSEQNDTLSMYLNRPTLNTSSMDELVRLNPALAAKKDLIHQIFKTNNIEFTAALII
jgi:hypothetical protein